MSSLQIPEPSPAPPSSNPAPTPSCARVNREPSHRAIRTCNEFEGDAIKTCSEKSGKQILPAGNLPPPNPQIQSSSAAAQEPWASIFSWLDVQKPKSSSEASEVPAWLSALLSAKFFNPCQIHAEAKKNERNAFCLDCCGGICPHCSPLHPSHRLLQIRRYVYHDVVRTSDALFINCDRIQTYTTNQAKVVFLKKRDPQKQPPKDSGAACVTCRRNLIESFLYCSIDCKLKHALRTGGELPVNLQPYEIPAGSDQMTPESVLEPALSLLTESASSSGGAPYPSSTDTTECSNSPVGISRRRRRKGTPHRSPRH